MSALGYLFAQAFHVTAAVTCTTDDSRGGGAVNRTLAAAWYRTFLCPAAGTGTETDPAELLLALETALGASYWRVRMTAAGLVRITYLSSGTGTLTIPSPLVELLGHTSPVVLAANTSLDGGYPPTHCVFAEACDPDGGWIDGPARFAGAALPTGRVYGWHDGRATLRRAATLTALPKTWAFRTSLSALGTPAFPAMSRALSPATSEPGQAPPWSALDTHATAAAVRCAVTWGEFASLVAGTVTTYDLVYLAPEQGTAGGRISLWRAGYDARRAWSFEVLFAGEGSL